MNRRLIVMGVLVAILSLVAALPPAGRAEAPVGQEHALVPFFSQTALRGATDDSGHPYYLGNSESSTKPYLLSGSGCTVASLAMVYSHYGMPTSIVQLNEKLKSVGGFAGALVQFDKPERLVKAGAPFVSSVDREPVAPSGPTKVLQERIDGYLLRGYPVIACHTKTWYDDKKEKHVDTHWVVLTDKLGTGHYIVNDPWEPNPNRGQNVKLEDTELWQQGFKTLAAVVFVDRSPTAPTNGVVVGRDVSSAYFARGGSAGPLGNPIAQEEVDDLLAGKHRWQRFANGMIVALDGGEAAVLYGPVYTQYVASGWVEALGVPLGSIYSYPSGASRVWRADFQLGSIVWDERQNPDAAEVLSVSTSFRADFFNNAELHGQPVYSRPEREINADWSNGIPGPWATESCFSVRWQGMIRVGSPVGWWYTFTVLAEGGMRLIVDGQVLLDGWSGKGDASRTVRLGRGEHQLTLEYAKRDRTGRIRAAWRPWPVKPVFADEGSSGPIDQVPDGPGDETDPPTPEPVETMTPMPLQTEPEQPVRLLFESLERKDVAGACQAFTPKQRGQARVLLEICRRVIDTQNANPSFVEMAYEVTENDGARATVAVSGLVVAGEEETIGDIDIVFPVVKIGDVWYVDLDIGRLVELFRQAQG